MTMINGKNAPNTLYLMCGMDHLGMKMYDALYFFALSHTRSLCFVLFCSVWGWVKLLKIKKNHWWKGKERVNEQTNGWTWKTEWDWEWKMNWRPKEKWNAYKRKLTNAELKREKKWKKKKKQNSHIDEVNETTTNDNWSEC